MTITPVIRIVLLVTLALALGAAAFTLIEHGNKQAATTTPSAVRNAATHHAGSTTAAHHPAQLHRSAHAVAAGASSPDAMPQQLAHALRYHSVVVAVLYAPGVTGEAGVVALARQGAHAAHAGFVALNVRTERIARAVALRFPGSFDPAVLILNRHGQVVTALVGVQQTTAVAQAALDAHR